MAQGMVVGEYPPYWLVVRRKVGRVRRLLGQGEAYQYVVVDTMHQVPRKVHGPCPLAGAETYARQQARYWAAMHGQSQVKE